MIRKPYYRKFRKGFYETLSEKGASVLRYRGADNKEHYIAAGDSADVMPGGGMVEVEVEGSTPEQELAPNTFYVFGSVTSLTVTLGAAVSGIASIYAFRFSAGQDDPTITLPQGVVCNQDLSLKTGDVCEFSIMDNKALFSVWEAQS